MTGAMDTHGLSPNLKPDEPLSVIIPANNEESYIGPCLAALLAQDAKAGPVQVVVAANGCTDRTVEAARQHQPAFAARGWTLEVLDIPEGGKPNALNRGEAAARGNMRVFLDADVICDPALLGQLRRALTTDAPRYATGRLQVARAQSWVTRAYARLWCACPSCGAERSGRDFSPSIRQGGPAGVPFPQSSRTTHSCGCNLPRTSVSRCRPSTTGR